MSAKAPLRFVLLCDSLEFHKWQADCLREAVGHGHAELVGVVIKQVLPARSKRTSKVRARWRKRHLAVWRIFNRVYVNRNCKALIAEDLSVFFSAIPRISESPIKVGRYGESFSKTTIKFIKEARPDFILRFGFGILKGDILHAAPFGVWSYHHGDPAAYRGQPPGFWECFSESPVTGSILQVLSEDLDAGTILHRGFFQTTLHSYSKTLDTIYFGSSSWVRRTCAAISMNGWPAAFASPPEAGPIFRQPSNLEMITFLTKAFKNYVKNQIRYRLFMQKWNCGVVPAPIDDVSGLRGSEMQRIALEKTKWMKVSRSGFCADPFGFEFGNSGRFRVYFESFDLRKKIGSISSCLYSDGEFEASQVVLDAKTHLSYPFIWTQHEVTYCLPEHSAARSLSAFQVGREGTFLNKITLFSDIELIDTSLVNWQGKLWAFATINRETINSELHIFFADKMEGPWRAHPLNPVKTDVRSARPAGTPFVLGRKLYRPAQDCSAYYGMATVVNEVRILSETDFKEIPVTRVAPLQSSRYEYGLHTLSQVGSVTFIDGATKAFVPSLPCPFARPPR